ncbi:MAG TPA: BlaI/MecI/CopY family transcriptional regulator [Candidatus Avoscillospira stercorigallinarum]|uniref:BlaI/MecI/CopY family transcriptional regulator n=1 Tax=Candidatus Avoscillospira stercorigallinarum TaxID=2840708 RepID=A0A9D1CP24_9FIRM|nr:BlaI/MecI/CopY family transcriptional regulator [Candidatus Avoscillospira stercorigallinarum]
MSMQKMGPLESRFADLIWSHEPLPSRELVRLAAEALSWKATTSYTVLKRLCDRGLFQNQGGTVTSLVSRADFYAMQSEQFVEETFEGSLPAFLAAFSSRKRLSDREIDELKAIIDGMRR